MEDLVPQLRAARGEGALTLLGVLLERGADIGAADLVSIAQSITSDLVYSERRSDVPDECESERAVMGEASVRATLES